MVAIASHLWQSTLVAAIAAALAWFLRNNSASVRFWIWFAASMKFLVPMAVFVAAADALPWPESAIESGALAAADVLFNSPALPSMSRTASSTLVLVWATGAVIFLARWLWEWIRMAVIARELERVTDGPVHEALRRLESVIGISAPTTIVFSPHNLEPGIIGIRKPVLVWPRHLSAGLRDDHLEPILAHELAHVLRRDNLVALFHMLVCAVFWFHPIVWWIGKRLTEERERACDERVLALGHSPIDYAAGIIKTCELCIASPLVNVPGVTGGDLKERIERIMRNTTTASLSFADKATLGFVAVAMVLVPVAVGALSARPQHAAPQPTAAQDDRQEPVRPGPGTNVTSPRLQREVRPHYSDRAKQEKIEGEVLLECVVKADGTVGDIKVIKPLHPDLDQAAVDAAKQWEFEPGTRDGKAVPVLVTIAIAFTWK